MLKHRQTHTLHSVNCLLMFVWRSRIWTGTVDGPHHTRPRHQQQFFKNRNDDSNLSYSMMVAARLFVIFCVSSYYLVPGHCLSPRPSKWIKGIFVYCLFNFCCCCYEVETACERSQEWQADDLRRRHRRWWFLSKSCQVPSTLTSNSRSKIVIRWMKIEF